MQRASRLALVLALFIPASLFAATRPSKQYTIEQFMNTVAVSGASFSPDEKEILFSSDESGIRNVYTIPVSGGKARALTTSTTDNDLFVHDVEKNVTRKISEHKGRSEFTGSDFDPSSKWLYIRTNDGSEFLRLRRYELATGKIEDVEKTYWDMTSAWFSETGKYRVAVLNEDARSTVRIVDTKTGKRIAMPKLPDKSGG